MTAAASEPSIANRTHDAGARPLPVCVIVPAYNRGSRLRRCLDSVWGQSALPQELIVVDDNSSDDTAEVAASMGARVIRHAENRGAAAARNTALQSTSCEWVAFLDSDDEWLPDHLAHLWELRDHHALVGSSVLYCRGTGGSDRAHGPVTRRPLVLRSPARLVCTYNMFTASACMLRRDVAVALGGFHKWWGVEDFDLWVRVLEHHSAVCSPRVTVLYHVHDEQLSSHASRMQEGHRAVVRAHLERTGASPVPLERWEGTAAWDNMRSALALGQRRTALRHALEMLRSRQRVIGVTLLLWSRILMRRRSSRIGRDGDASIAILLRDPSRRRTVLERLSGRTVRDLSELSTPRALLALVHRPAGRVVARSNAQAAMLRVAGVQALAPQQIITGTDPRGAANRSLVASGDGR
jgi:GT2 family glycosyltransferase